MTADEWREIKPQLHRVLMLEGDRRSGPLEELVQQYPALREEIEGLAASIQDVPDDYLTPESAWWSSLSGEQAPALSVIGTRMGPYEIIEKIGAGGMGEVFRAQRADREYEKQVAIKVVRGGYDSAFILRRFKQERQILASFDHPNIARLLDGGTSPQGLPYFVMELIDGSRITDYCEKQTLGIDARLKLFIQVCRAVEYAHQHAIIHRDIKPDNILVTAEGVPKLLDFGIAKLLAPDLTVSNPTMSMFRPLTPAYASPEQISSGPITKSTDIYSLGVVLYELLCGRGPYGVAGGDPDDLAREVLETDPPPPSRAWLHKAPHEDGGAGPGQSQRPPREQLRPPHGDLDIIVMTALRKEPERRYASGDAFALDLELYLEQRPILARKDSLPYRAAKFGRRNPALLITMSLVLIAICASVATRMWQPHSTASVAHPSVRVRPSVAVLGFKSAGRGAAPLWVPAALSEVLRRNLAAGGELRTVSRELVAKSKVDLGIGDAEVLDHSSANSLRRSLDTDYIILGSYSLANGELRLDIRAQDARTGETVASASDAGPDSSLVELALRVGSHLRQRLGIADLTAAEVQSLTASFPIVPDALHEYSEGIEKLNRLDAEGAKAALVAAAGKEPGHALSHLALSSAWSMLGYEQHAADEARKAAALSAPLSRPDQLAIEAQYEETIHQKAKALDIYKTLFGLFPDDIECGLQLADSQTGIGKGHDALATLTALGSLPDPIGKDPRIHLAEANAASSLGDYQLGMSAVTEAVRGAEADGTRSIVALAYLRQGVAFRHIKDLAHAQQSFQSSLALYLAIGNLRGAASAWNGLGNVFNQRGDIADSRHAYEQAIALYRQIGDRGEMAAILGNLANVIGDQGDLDGSMKLYEQELKVAREIEDRRMISETLNNIAIVEVLRGRLRAGINDFQQSGAILSDLGDIDYVAQGLDGLGGAQLLCGDVAQAIDTFNEELSDYRKVGDDQAVAYALGSLGSALAMSGDLKGAEKNLDQALAMNRKSGEKHFIAQNLTELGVVHFYEARDQEARKELEEAMAIHDAMGENYTQEETRLDLAELDLVEARYDEAASLAHRALSEAEKEHLRDQQLIAHATLARVFARQHRARQARIELATARSSTARSQNLAARFTFTIARAEAAQSTLSNELRRELESVVAQAQQHRLVPYQYEAALLLGLDEASSKGSQRCNRLDALRNEASTRGFERVAESAASVCH